MVQWQCKNHRKDGKVNCKNAYVDNADLERGFIKAFNKLCKNREKYVARWMEQAENGSSLEKIRAGQMMEITEKEPLKKFVPEMAQLVIQEITILGAKKYEFVFMEGSKVKVSV